MLDEDVAWKTVPGWIPLRLNATDGAADTGDAASPATEEPTSVATEPTDTTDTSETSETDDAENESDTDSKTMTDYRDVEDETESTVFQNNAEREGARAAFLDWLATEAGVPVEEIEAETDVDEAARASASQHDLEPDAALYLLARDVGWTSAGCDHTDERCEHDREALGIDTETVEPPVRGNADPFTAGDDPAFTEPRGATTQVNLAGIPGPLDRAARRSNASDEDVLIGGRTAWERRKTGLEQIPDDEPPTGGRSAWEARSREHSAYPFSEQRQEARERELRERRRRRWQRVIENAQDRWE